ncbi:MAG: hypothetical protein E7012_00860 [Alphaproteobacteria bacterium]|nr:hypothetical protein [Alphaproteobacteria bacterium]
MYIWVILATFLAMLASYSLAIRPDMRSITVEPVAEAVLGKIIVQHEAAKSYVKYKKFPYSADKKKVEYQVGVVSEDDLKKELPFGFIMNNDYVSQIFCMDPTFSEAYSHNPTNNPCDLITNRRLLITYGPIPPRWMSLSAEMQRPNLDLMNAMRSIVNVGEKFGYMALADAEGIANTEDNPSGSNVRLVDRDGVRVNFVPKAIVNDVTFKSKCDLSSNKICMIYVSNI